MVPHCLWKAIIHANHYIADHSTIDPLQVSCCHSNIRHLGVQPVFATLRLLYTVNLYFQNLQSKEIVSIMYVCLLCQLDDSNRYVHVGLSKMILYILIHSI